MTRPSSGLRPPSPRQAGRRISRALSPLVGERVREAGVRGVSSTAPLRTAARIPGALFARLENGEHPFVRWVRELGDRVCADLVRLVARELVPLLVDERLSRSEVDRAVTFEHASRCLLELE